jgi:hypothetical protein
MWAQSYKHGLNCEPTQPKIRHTEPVLKSLRNPIALLLLTAAVLFWTLRVASLSRDPFKTIFAHTSDDSPPFEYIDGDTHRPAYELARWCMGKPNGRSFEIGISLTGITTIVRDANGLRIYDPKWDMLDDEFLYFEQIAAIVGKRQIDEYGFLSGFAVRHRTSVEALPISAGSTSSLSPAVLDEALNNSLNPNTPRVINGVQTRWVFKPLAAAHDLAYLITLTAWLISLTGVPRWLIWKRLTPAQRRRAKHRCPNCAYDLADLTSPTCPECGHKLLSPA